MKYKRAILKSTVSVLGLKKLNYIDFYKQKSSHFYNGCFCCITNVFKYYLLKIFAETILIFSVKISIKLDVKMMVILFTFVIYFLQPLF